jgi:hypothetical protein
MKRALSTRPRMACGRGGRGCTERCLCGGCGATRIGWTRVGDVRAGRVEMVRGARHGWHGPHAVEGVACTRAMTPRRPIRLPSIDSRRSVTSPRRAPASAVAPLLAARAGPGRSARNARAHASARNARAHASRTSPRNHGRTYTRANTRTSNQAVECTYDGYMRACMLTRYTQTRTQTRSRARAHTQMHKKPVSNNVEAEVNVNEARRVSQV